MLNVYTGDQRDEWNSIVKSFKNWDIYYLFEYANTFEVHGDGEPLLLVYQDEDAYFCYVVMQSDIADCPQLTGRLEKGRYYDFSSPYGYGGPLTDRTIPEQSQKKYLQEVRAYGRENHIISQFIRFHPLLGNDRALPLAIETRYLRDTIYIDTSSREIIMSNMDSKNRNMVRKGIKSGVTIVQRPITDYQEFSSMYEETMKRNEADSYYLFSESYFRAQMDLADYACIFYAIREEIPIAGSIMYYNHQFMHYHLSGACTEYRRYAPSNLLLYEAGCWASERGIRKLHLGGGMSADDSLFGFKKQFNKNGKLPFAIGRTIFDAEAYAELMKLRKAIDPSFDEENSRMIQYRK